MDYRAGTRSDAISGVLDCESPERLRFEPASVGTRVIALPLLTTTIRLISTGRVCGPLAMNTDAKHRPNHGRSVSQFIPSRPNFNSLPASQRHAGNPEHVRNFGCSRGLGAQWLLRAVLNSLAGG